MNKPHNLPTLNPAQQEAVDHQNGPCIVLAGPGAGKTAVLTRRTAKLVSSGVNPERILLLTFTRASAKEMLDRAKMLNPLCEKVDGGTFHSVAARIVNQNSHLFDKTKDFTILDPSDSLTAVKHLIDVVKINDSTDWPQPSTVQRVISYATNTRSSISDAVYSVAPNYTHLISEFEKIRDLFFDYKISRCLLDYDDCLEYFAALLQDADIGTKLRKKWDYIMVDEYQDTNQLQLDIVYNLSNGSNANTMIVGDPGQSIFSFRGSAPETMKGFNSKYPKSKIINLDTNYRSTPEIVDIVNSIDKRLGIGFSRTLISNQVSGDDLPHFIETNDTNTQARDIADNILAHKTKGGKLSDNAVVVRAMAYARAIELEFAKRQIPYRIVGGLRIDEAAHVKDLLSIARLAINPQHDVAWLRVLPRFKRVGAKAASGIIDKVTQSESVTETVEMLDDIKTNQKLNFQGLPSAISVFGLDNLTPVQKLELVVQHMEPFWQTIKEWKEDWTDRKKDLEAIISIADGHPTVESFLTTITLDYSIDNKVTREKETLIDDMVTITSVHGAKGLEWPRVHIPSFNSGHIPSSYSTDVKEEMRILYVAVSRAKKELLIYKTNFLTSGSFASESEFEPLIKRYCTIKRSKQDKTQGRDKIQSNNKIDMRAVVANMKKKQTA